MKTGFASTGWGRSVQKPGQETQKARNAAKSRVFGSCKFAKQIKAQNRIANEQVIYKNTFYPKIVQCRAKATAFMGVF
ncbi:hypothetical protein [Caldicellulosiruptor bescii]|uniref:hypothetical protein n=1 Tax=Caldicellulosiruptor bescii TaxID=31899 RepID=UPI00059EEF41|nr:hypothetical protein [Caldicellulosiruptor bescii]